MRALSPSEAERFLEKAKVDSYFTLFTFALVTGMRPGEYMGLKWEDVDFKNNTVMVRRSLVRSDEDWYFSEPKTRARRRMIDLPQETMDMLKAHKEEQKASHHTHDHGLVFTTETGNPVHQRNLVRRHFKKMLKEAARPQRIRLYDGCTLTGEICVERSAWRCISLRSNLCWQAQLNTQKSVRVVVSEKSVKADGEKDSTVAITQT